MRKPSRATYLIKILSQLMNHFTLSAMAIAMAGVGFTSMEAHAAQISSPSGTVTLEADVIDSVPTYSVSYKGIPVIKPSTLGFELADGPDMMDGFKLIDTATASLTRHGNPCGARTVTYATITTNCCSVSISLNITAR